MGINLLSVTHGRLSQSFNINAARTGGKKFNFISTCQERHEKVISYIFITVNPNDIIRNLQQIGGFHDEF